MELTPHCFHWREQTVGQRFEAIAKVQPEAPAVWSGGLTMTYGHLNRAANQVARQALAKLGDGEVPVLLDSVEQQRLLVAVLGLAKAGKPFVVVNAGMGEQARRAIVEDLEPGMILGNEDIVIDVADIANPLVEFDAERAASIVYTSGTSARPKGVVRTHRNLLHRAWTYWDASGVGPGDVQALMAPLSHVGAESDLFGAWLNGAQVSHHPASLGVTNLTDWLVEQKVTLWHPPVGLLRRWLGLLERPLSLPNLRLLALGGEPVYWSDVRAIRKLCGDHVRILHRYSSSEAGNIAAYEVGKELGPDGDALPAGFASRDRVVSITEAGEVVVRSAYLSRGYWKGRPFGDTYHTGDLGRLDTAGCLHLEGRSDRRVKLRGFLVDLAEVEGVLQSIEGVREAAVIADGDRLLAYIVKPPPDLEQQAAERMPPWMIPNAYIALNQLPLTVTGKVDRKALPLPEAQAVAPREGLEEELVRLWRLVLNRNEVGATDHFFEMGGDSLRAAELVARISKLVGREVPASALYWSPTARQMREVIEQNRIIVGGLVPLVQGAGEPLLLLPPSPSGTTFYRDLPAVLDGPVFTFDVQWQRQDIHATAQRIATEVKARWPRQKLTLAGFSFAGNLAIEVARLLGDRVRAVVLIDSLAPGFESGRDIDHRTARNRLVVWQYMLQCWVFELRTWFKLRGEARKKFGRQTLKSLSEKLNAQFILRRLFTETPPTAQLRSARHYATSVYQGRVHMVRFATQYPATPPDPYLGWQRWVEGPLTAVEIEGIHLPCVFLSPWLPPLVEILRKVRMGEDV